MQNEGYKARQPFVHGVVCGCVCSRGCAYARVFVCSNDCIDSMHLNVGMNEG